MTDTTVEAPATPRLKQKYNEQIVPELEKEFHYSNPMQVARVQKVVVSMGVGAAARDSKLIEGAVKDLTLITGQKPKITKAKKSVAQFHLREGQAIGAYVTLRGERMWEFLDRLLTMALPRIRDFRGINGNQFDGQGNYNFGLTEQSMFHEIEGYIKDFTAKEAKVGQTLEVTLKYGPNGERSIQGIKRISKPGLRRYAKSDALPMPLGGLGIAIISTSSGLLTQKECLDRGIGGEIVAFVW